MPVYTGVVGATTDTMDAARTSWHLDACSLLLWPRFSSLHASHTPSLPSTLLSLILARVLRNEGLCVCPSSSLPGLSRPICPVSLLFCSRRSTAHPRCPYSLYFCIRPCHLEFTLFSSWPSKGVCVCSRKARTSPLVR